MRTSASRRRARLVVAGAASLLVLELAAVLGERALVDRRAYVSELRLDSAMQTFRPVDRSGLAEAVDPRTFAPERNPRTSPATCEPLAMLASAPPVDGRSWTGVNGRPAQPVSVLAVRFADAGDARAELIRKRAAMLSCHRVAITFPPFAGPPTTYRVVGEHWLSSAVGSTVRWSLVGGDKRFDFYVRRFGNTLLWTYADDVSAPQVREEVADDLVTRLADLANR